VARRRAGSPLSLGLGCTGRGWRRGLKLDPVTGRSVTQFFSLSAILIAVLAVVLAGKGVAALQEASLVDTWPMPGVPRVELLGIYPTREACSCSSRQRSS